MVDEFEIMTNLTFELLIIVLKFEVINVMHIHVPIFEAMDEHMMDDMCDLWS